MTQNVKQTDLRLALSAFVENSFAKTNRRCQRRHEDRISRADTKGKEQEKKLKYELNAKKPVLPKAEQKVVTEQKSPNFIEDFSGLAKIMFGGMEAEMNNERQLAEFNNQSGKFNVKMTELNLTKQQDLLEKQNKLNAKVAKTESLIGKLNTAFIVLSVISAVLPVVGECASGLLAVGEGLGEDMAEGAVESGVRESLAGAADVPAEQASGKLLGEGAEIGVEEGSEHFAAEASDHVIDMGMSVDEHAGEIAEENAVQKASSESSKTTAVKKWLWKRIPTTKQILVASGSVAGATPQILESHFNFVLSRQHNQLANQQLAVGESTANLKKVNAMYTYFQKAVQRQTGVIQEESGQAGDVIESASSLFNAEKAMSSLLAQAV